MEYRFDYEYFLNIQDGEALGNMERRIQDALNLLRNEGDCIVLVDTNGAETRCSTENGLRNTLAARMNHNN